MSGISRSQVSRLREEIDNNVKAFLGRRSKPTGRICSVAVIVVVGVHRMLSIELKPTWRRLFIGRLINAATFSRADLACTLQCTSGPNSCVFAPSPRPERQA